MEIYIKRETPSGRTALILIKEYLEAEELPSNDPETNANHKASSGHSAFLTIKRSR